MGTLGYRRLKKKNLPVNTRLLFDATVSSHCFFFFAVGFIFLQQSCSRGFSLFQGLVAYVAHSLAKLAPSPFTGSASAVPFALPALTVRQSFPLPLVEEAPGSHAHGNHETACLWINGGIHANNDRIEGFRHQEMPKETPKALALAPLACHPERFHAPTRAVQCIPSCSIAISSLAPPKQTHPSKQPHEKQAHKKNKEKINRNPPRRRRPYFSAIWIIISS
jgi:hypothetical protein